MPDNTSQWIIFFIPQIDAKTFPICSLKKKKKPHLRLKYFYCKFFLVSVNLYMTHEIDIHLLIKRVCVCYQTKELKGGTYAGWMQASHSHG